MLIFSDSSVIVRIVTVITVRGKPYLYFVSPVLPISLYRKKYNLFACGNSAVT